MSGGILDSGRSRLALAGLVAAVAVVTLDTTILNVAIPTIGRDLHADLASLQWVIAGYSLTLGSLLIIGGRVGDVVGVRRTFAAGALLFASGSLLASLATSTTVLVMGEAVVEGIGASLLFPASLAALSRTFDGPARAKAFALWGGVAGAAAALGPVIGGWPTTDYSWRWGFRVNVIVAPLAGLAALRALPRGAGRERRWHVDGWGAGLLAGGLFMVVFALTEAPAHGWLTNHGPGIALGALTVWSPGWWLSPAAAALAVAMLSLLGFVRVERRRAEPLVDLSVFGRRSFGAGLTTAAAVVMAQAGTMFVLAVFLQTSHHLSAIGAGRWSLPVGVAALIGAQTGGRSATVTTPTVVVRAGIVIQLAGVLTAAAVLRTAIGWAPLAGTLAVFGFGAGMASSQLTNVVLSEVPRERAGSASGVSTTNNALAAALGVAVLGAVLRAGALDIGAARWALLAAAGLLAAGALASFTIRTTGPAGSRPRVQPEPGHGAPIEVLEGAAAGAPPKGLVPVSAGRRPPGSPGPAAQAW